MADEVHAGGRAAHGGQLGRRLLGVVLTDVWAAGRYGRLHGVGAEALGDGHDADALTAGGGDPGPHGVQPLRHRHAASRQTAMPWRSRSPRRRCDQYRSSHAVHGLATSMMVTSSAVNAARTAAGRSSAGRPHDVVAVTDGPKRDTMVDSSPVPNS